MLQRSDRQYIVDLKELCELPDFVVVVEYINGSAGGRASNIVHMIMSNQVVWHTSCRNAVDNQKVQRGR